MTAHFYDTSGLAKRYMLETGTTWVRQQMKQQDTEIFVAQITPVELYSAVGRQYHDGQITKQRMQAFRRLLVYHVQNQYLIVALSQNILDVALNLHEMYRLRAYDSIQLASALVLRDRLNAAGQVITFVCADNRLIDAANMSGLPTQNPNDYI